MFIRTRKPNYNKEDIESIVKILDITNQKADLDEVMAITTHMNSEKNRSATRYPQGI